VRDFAALHKLNDLTVNPEDTGAVATVPPSETTSVYTEMNRQARAISKLSEIIRHELTVRYDELNIRLNAVQEYSKEDEPQSAVGLFFSETFAWFLPWAFTFTHSHRQASEYAKVAQQILEGNLTLSIIEKTSNVTQRIEKISDLMNTARAQLH
ncbi:hypothetical protein, partial [Campylobacter jejuni]|uniref:hypothetical protein n=1 Tax=Campylobacter jejuni TaxID=197 RepID=UPI00211C2D2D